MTDNNEENAFAPYVTFFAPNTHDLTSVKSMSMLAFISKNWE